jgi:hypothetical protein
VDVTTWRRCAEPVFGVPLNPQRVLIERLRYEYHKLKCSKCGRKILVEIGLISVSHNAMVSVTCAECLRKVKLSNDFKRRFKKVAADIEKWLDESG